jgi:GT2 family glycosyltransferase
MSHLVLAINYRSEPDALRLAGDLGAQAGGPEDRFVFVDNTAHQFPAPRLAAIAANDPRFRYFPAGANLGYFGGAAWGREQLLAEGMRPDWTIITNTDIRIPDPAFLTRLAGIRGAAVVGPRIVSGLSGQDQNPYLPVRPDGRRMRWYKWMFASHLRLSAYEFAARVKKKVQQRHSAEVRDAGPVYAVHGSFLALHRSYFEAGGGITPGTFLFGEEILVAEHARRLRLEVRYDPTLEVLHAEHATTSVFTNRVVAGYVAQASAWVADTYFANDP